MRPTLTSSLLGIFAATLLSAQDTPPPETPVPPETPAPPRPGGLGPQAAEPQPYDKVITKEAKTSKGIFTVHQVKERYFYEIPKGQLEKEFLWNTQIAKTTVRATDTQAIACSLENPDSCEACQ